MLKILLLTDYSQESERRFLNGFVKYADTQGGCIFHPMSHLIDQTKDNSMEIIRMAKKFKVDAILGLWHNINVEEAKKLNSCKVLVDNPYTNSYSYSCSNNEITCSSRFTLLLALVSGHGGK